MEAVAKCNRGLLWVFYKYGYTVGQYPWPFLLVSVVVCGALSVGILQIDPETDMEKLFTPIGSEAHKQAEIMMKTFPNDIDDNYTIFSLNDIGPYIKLIFRTTDGGNILEANTLMEIKDFIGQIKRETGRTTSLDEACATYNQTCVIDGDYVFSPTFRTLLDDGNITYPLSAFFPRKDLSLNIAREKLKAGFILEGAESIKLSYALRLDGGGYFEDLFLTVMEKIDTSNLTNVEVAYTTSSSLDDELDKGTKGDIIFFAMTLAMMITYACIVGSGGDCVSTRSFLSTAGVAAATLGIASSLGLITLTGVRYVNVVGTMPFLLIGICVNDMLLVMSAWTETIGKPELTIPERIGLVFKKSGIGITIASVTDFLSFAVGATSAFRSVQNFCIYTGTGVMMCYVGIVTFFAACLTLHGRRVYSSRHTLTCRKVKSRDELKAEGRSMLYVLCCGGSVPTTSGSDQNPCERAPRRFLPGFVLLKPVRVVIFIIFLVYLGLSIWGCTKLEEGLNTKDIVKSTSFVHRFEKWDNEDFGLRLPIAFATTKTKNYRLKENYDAMVHLLAKAKQSPLISPDVEVCWLTAFRQSPYFSNVSDSDFIAQLERFMKDVHFANFANDVVIENGLVTASRCSVFSNKMTTQYQQADLMESMRDVAEGEPAADFAYHPSFVFFEQFVQIKPQTLQTVGITVAVMVFVTAVFLPNPIVVILVTVQVLSILAGIFGFMAFWDLTLSAITMVHLIISVGFSVDFTAHVCTAYMVSEMRTREERAKDAMMHASGPILNGGISSLVGVLGLVFSESFIFQSFLKVMVLVISFGVLHAVFFVPVILSVIGPKTYLEHDDDVNIGNHQQMTVRPASVDGGDSHSNQEKSAYINTIEDTANGNGIHEKLENGKTV